MPDETVTLRYPGPARLVRFAAYDVEARQGEVVTVDPETDVLTHVDDDGTEHTRPLDQFLVERHGFERVQADYTAVLDQSVDDLRDPLATGEYDDRLDALAHAEREGENRKTALEAIDARRSEVE